MKCPVCGSMFYHVGNNCGHCLECNYFIGWDMAAGESRSSVVTDRETIDNE